MVVAAHEESRNQHEQINRGSTRRHAVERPAREIRGVIDENPDGQHPSKAI
jgi:hypothetical protein